MATGTKSGSRNGTGRGATGGDSEPQGAAPIRDRGTNEKVTAHCADMSYTTLCEVFEQRGNLTKRAARDAGLVFRGVATTIGAVNSLEKMG
jgi:hypothetical protein